MAETHPDAPGPTGEPASASLPGTTGGEPAPASLSGTGGPGRGPPRSAPGVSTDARAGTECPGRTWTVLIAALGGEGGGVLSNWLVDAAATDGRAVQATSVPGVAQRTGATTYYLEIGPRDSGDGVGAAAPDDGGLRPDAIAGTDANSGAGTAASAGAGSPNGPAVRTEPHERGAHRAPVPVGPVMALLPTPGNVDLLVASELLEAGRAAQTGMITPDRTTVIASTHRTFAIAEKSAMGDGRFEDERIHRAVRELSRRHVLTDLGRVANRARTVLSSVLLGAVAGSGALPIPRERLRAAVERAGIAVEANLRGFEAGFRLCDEMNAGSARSDSPAAAADTEPEGAGTGPAQASRTPAGMAPGATSTRTPVSLATRVSTLPGPVREIARLGVERTVDYQDARYGALYLDRIERLLARAESVGTAPEDALGIAREAARQLALWMCFEDIVRVADLKTRRSRMERVRAEVRAKPGQPVIIAEFLKPGVDEWCSLLPAWLARPILRSADRRGWRRRLNVGLHVRTSSVTGFLLLWTLARLRPLRRGMHRYVEEQARIETWIERVGEACATSAAFALEVARCANLVKGYGDTRERGVLNLERTMSCLGACARSRDPASSLRILREAALADPEGDRLDAAIAAFRRDLPPVGSG